MSPVRRIGHKCDKRQGKQKEWRSQGRAVGATALPPNFSCECKFNEIYTRYVYFRGFFMHEMRLRPGPLDGGAFSVPLDSVAGREVARCPPLFSVDFRPFGLSGIRPSQL